MDAVETMFYTRETPWHGLGVRVEEAPNSEAALKLAGLDWTVKPEKVYAENGKNIPWAVANVRDSDGKVLGLVSPRYKIVQNRDAFSFTDNLIGEDARYETAGSLFGGSKVWLLARLPDAVVAGDVVAPYLCFTNTHDGSGAIKACITPVRVVCNNTLNIALKEAVRTWSTRHIGSVESKMEEAQSTLMLANEYMEALAVKADEYANTTISRERLATIIDKLFPIEEDMSERAKNNMVKLQDRFIVAYRMPDIKKFEGTAWGVINAASDFLHFPPIRETKNAKANAFNEYIGGHSFIDKVVKLVG